MTSVKPVSRKFMLLMVAGESLKIWNLDFMAIFANVCHGFKGGNDGYDEHIATGCDERLG